MRKIAKFGLIAIICFTISIVGINAKSYIKDLFVLDEKVTIDNELNGTAFIAGNDVNIKNSINGIGFIAGNDLSITGDQEYIFAAGTEVQIDANVEKDLFLAGDNITLKNNSIGRDAYIAGNKVVLDSTFNRNIYIYGTTVELKGIYNGNVTIAASEIKVDDSAKILGTLKYNKDAQINSVDSSIKTKTYKLNENKVTFMDYIVSFINTYIHITLVAIIIVFVFERVLKASLKQTKDKKLSGLLGLCGKGLLILIGVPIIAFTLLMTGWFVSVGMIGGIIYGILVYISSIFTGYYIGHVLDSKFIKKNMNSYLLVIIGLLIIYLLKLVPILGIFVTLISLTLGLGILGNMIIELKK